MDEQGQDQKTEEPTSKRIQDSQEKGNFANSREFTSTVILLMAILSFSIAGSFSAKRLLGTWNYIINQSFAIGSSVEDLHSLLTWILKNILVILSPILLSIMFGGVLANLIQTGGPRFSIHPLKLKFNKLNPLKGVKRIFSSTALMELFKSIFKISIIAFISFITVKGRFQEIPALMDMGVGQILHFLGEVGLEIMIKVLLVMLFLAIIDFAFQKFTYIKNLRMTKQELKDERKDTEGNPQVKQRVRSVQLDMMKRRMMSAVPDADVVVTNPTHIAVAIQYDHKNFDAPIVVAKGSGQIAEKIKKLARDNDIPLIEDKPLARLLFQTVEIGQMIPEKLYRAVAEILAYVFRLKGKALV